MLVTIVYWRVQLDCHKKRWYPIVPPSSEQIFYCWWFQPSHLNNKIVIKLDPSSPSPNWCKKISWNKTPPSISSATVGCVIFVHVSCPSGSKKNLQSSILTQPPLDGQKLSRNKKDRMRIYTRQDISTAMVDLLSISILCLCWMLPRLNLLFKDFMAKKRDHFKRKLDPLPTTQHFWGAIDVMFDILPRKTNTTLTRQWNITSFNRRYIVKCLFFHCRVRFSGEYIRLVLDHLSFRLAHAIFGVD